MALSCNLHALKVQRLEKILAQPAALKVLEWPSYGNCRKVTQNPHFLKKCKGGNKGNFSKIAQKVALVWKANSALAQMSLSSTLYPLIMRRRKNIMAQKAAPKLHEWASYCNFRKVTQKPHFLKKCKGGTRGNLSKIAQTVALVWKAQKHSGANNIILYLVCT